MATLYKCPVCLWESHQGKVTARLIDDYEEGVAVGNSKKECLEQLREYLVHRSKHDEFFWLETDFDEAEIRQVRVRIVPEYRDEGRRYPCKEPILLKLPCAVGKRSSGLWAACFPTLDLYFDFYDKSQFGDLANHYAKQFLSEMTPRELSRFLPPASCELDTLNVSLKEPPTSLEEPDLMRTLLQVADPIGKRTLGRLGRVWSREKEIAAASRGLGEENANVCLLGESNCGKTSILAEAARRLERDNPNRRSAPRFWLTSAARMIAGMRYLGEWEQRCEQAIRELANLRAVLCFENLLDLLNTGGTGPENSLAAFLIPYIRSGELRIASEATPHELEASDRLLPGLIDEMQIVRIEPFDETQALSVLGYAADYFSQNERLHFAPAAARETYHLFHRFQPYVAFPGKAIQLMGAVVDRKVQESATEIQPNDVRAEFSAQTGLPDLFLREDIPLEYDHLAREFHQRLLGQQEAVDQVCRTITKFKAGLNDPGRPVGVMLFAGPTGVGKTQMVKLIGNYLFPHKPEKDRLVRLDMSEYSGHDAAERLLGNILGRPSELIQKVRANPFSVVLLDEIEKASHDVFDVLMNVFEEGRLTDPLGRLTCFNSAILIMTSNLGSSHSGPLGFGESGTEEYPAVHTDFSAIRNFFRPEFFNRIDHVVPFNPLGKSTILEITRIELNEATRREGFRDRRIQLRFHPDLVQAVARAGFDPAYGVRPLQRSVEEIVVMPLARLLVKESVRDQTIELGWDESARRLTIVTGPTVSAT